MRYPKIRKSTAGLVAGSLYLALFFAVFCWIFLVASKNPADSGESGILLLPFAMPWVMWLPVEWLGPLTATACVFINSLLLYLLFGGLRFERSKGKKS
jgi:hypothetical protein